MLAAAAFAIGLATGSSLTPNSMGSSRESLAIAPPRAEIQASRQQLPGIHPAEVLRILDGDTFEARVHIWPGVDVTTKVRLRGIDAPELKARCAEEYAKAVEARDALKAILAGGGVTISRVTFDKYGGRVVADASTHATPNISDALLKSGLARGYSGGRRETRCR